ncbi:switch-associated protein 70-like [Macrobrachium rosenbergii]|uniref:switch-associated protein 70-like n=1 Tax=Macrobrachium rosenbergii TaxID=79674 RepID=UPI0034D74C1B
MLTCSPGSPAMATLGQLVANSLWFAFDALDHQKTGVVAKSQLKVLTQNVGVLLKVDRRVENCIEDYLSSKQLTFEQYLYFLTHEVLAEVDDGSTPYKDLKLHHDILENTFWLLGRTAFLQRDTPVFSEDSVYKLFRIFCLLADRSPSRKGLLQVTLNVQEMSEVTRYLVTALGREWDCQDFHQLASIISCFTFPVFLTFLEGRYAQDAEVPALHQAVNGIYSSFIGQVLKRGKVYQRAWWAPVWVSRELEIVPWAVTTPSQKLSPKAAAVAIVVGKAQVSLTPSATVHSIPDEPDAKNCRFTICLESNKLVQLAATDHRSKSEWLRALDTAIQYSTDPLPYQSILSTIRKSEHAEEEARETAERIRRASQADIIENTQAELMAEKLARAEAEAAAKQEAAARQEEEKRVTELQKMRLQLETLLEEETQAKRDEEIVRNLQARVLSEEWEKREELERLQAEQRRMLEEEKKKRQAFEVLQEEKDSQLREAEKRLRKLEADRLRLDRELRSAREKIVMSERGKELLEAKMKVKERTPPVRTYSLRPIRKERGSTPIRSSSFNAHAARLFKFRSKTEDSNGNENSNGTVESV